MFGIVELTRERFKREFLPSIILADRIIDAAFFSLYKAAETDRNVSMFHFHNRLDHSDAEPKVDVLRVLENTDCLYYSCWVCLLSCYALQHFVRRPAHLMLSCRFGQVIEQKAFAEIRLLNLLLHQQEIFQHALKRHTRFASRCCLSLWDLLLSPRETYKWFPVVCASFLQVSAHHRCYVILMYGAECFRVLPGRIHLANHSSSKFAYFYILLRGCQLKFCFGFWSFGLTSKSLINAN